MLEIHIPGTGDLRLEHLLLDVNGTLTSHGHLLDGVTDRLAQLRRDLHIQVLSADTFSTAEGVARAVGGDFRRVHSGDEKRQCLDQLGASACVAIGNGVNDVLMLRHAALGIAVLGPEGLASAAAAAADVVATSITDALDLLLDPRALVATLRA